MTGWPPHAVARGRRQAELLMPASVYEGQQLGPMYHRAPLDQWREGRRWARFDIADHGVQYATGYAAHWALVARMTITPRSTP